MIRIDGRMQDIERFDYFYNGSMIMAVVSKKGNNVGSIVGSVPKKYWLDILLTPNIVEYGHVSNSIPSTVKPTSKVSTNRYIRIKESKWK